MELKRASIKPELSEKACGLLVAFGLSSLEDFLLEESGVVGIAKDKEDFFSDELFDELLELDL